MTTNDGREPHRPPPNPPPPSRPGAPLRFGRDDDSWVAQVLVDLGFSYGQTVAAR